MSPVEFAQKHLQPHKTRGNEIIPLYCPFCRGGDGKDKGTFAVNAQTGTYNCKRGSCGVSGTFKQLCREFGETAGDDAYYRRPEKHFKAPTLKPAAATEKVAAYLKSRGISPATWQRRGVGEHKGAIAFPYFENGGLVLMKFRPAHKPDPKEKKGWREEGGKAVFWGMDTCKTDKPLVIVEGEIDALSLDEAGIENVVSVPNGAEDLTCLENCWDWIRRFKYITLWVDNDPPGRKLEHNLIQRLGAWRCSVVRHKLKDANDVLLAYGRQAVADTIAGAIAVPMEGLVSLADVPLLDYSDVVRVRSGISGIDRVIGGFMMGELSVWTGINSSGKSTLLGQFLIEAVNQGFVACAYSGELPARVFRYWIDLQAAGPQYLEMRRDEIRGREIPHAHQDAVKKIRAWYRDKFYLFDSFGAASDTKIIEVFEYAAMRYGCRVFMVDNLMTTVFTGNDRDFYRQQSNFIGKLKDFSHRHDVHVHVVAHPRKTAGRLTKMDVSGSGDITNRADNVFSVHRCTKDEEHELNCSTMVDIFKNRFSGQQDVSVQLVFDDRCKRFCMAGNPADINKKFGWLNVREGDYSIDDF